MAEANSEMALEILFDMVLRSDFPYDVRKTFINNQRLANKDYPLDMLMDGRGEGIARPFMLVDMEREFGRNLSTNSSAASKQRVLEYMDKVQDVYSFLYLFHLALAQEL